MSLETIIRDLGLDSVTGMALAITGLALLIIIILFMNYFNILLTIANFAYPNARLRALGNPYIYKNNLTALMETSGVGEAALEISKEGYDLPQDIEKTGMDEAERQLELAHIGFLKKVLHSDPESLKPFLEAYLLKFDISQVKKALRAKKNGTPTEELKKRLVPVNEVTDEVIETLLEAASVDEVCYAVKGTRFGDALIKAAGEHKDNIVLLELVLDSFLFQELRHSITRVGTPVRESVTLFVGKYADITNIKHIIRSKQQGLDARTTEMFLVKGSRSVASWQLKKMIEVQSLQELVTELEGTPYADTIKEGFQGYNETKNLYALEHAFDRLLLVLVSEISAYTLISAGPTIKYIVVKEFEVRNLKVVLRGLYEKLPPDRIMPMLIMED